ncbi:MAG TPA: methyltransferase domain-containing protein [Gemmata sp.]|jgi:SAM-dependent methyltransferase|nr:methyltransferase domain-containing protein [Gemmata sp.]
MNFKAPDTSWFSALTATVREAVSVDGHVFQIDRPADSAAVFAHPAVKAVNAADEYLPHWIKLWPAARMLAAAIVREPWETYTQMSPGTPLDVLELGCGLGLAGIAALARGLRVTFSDLDETALVFAANNARLNDFTSFDTLPLDFRNPPERVKYPVVIGSDLIYQDRLVRPLVGLLHSILAPGGVCLITDQNRPDGKRFQWHLAEAGFTVESESVQLEEPGREAITGTLYRIRFAIRKTGW